MATWVSKADDARRLIGRLVDEVHRGQIGRASELCDPVDIDALPVLMDAAHAADAADARVAELEAVLHVVMTRAELTLEASDGHGARLTLVDAIEDIRAVLATPATGSGDDEGGE